MGCLMELIFEILIEGIIELFGHCYIKLMQLIVPKKAVTEKTKKVVKVIASVNAAILAITLVIGLILTIQEDPDICAVGGYMVYIPLGIIALQIVLGIISKLIGHFRR